MESDSWHLIPITEREDLNEEEMEMEDSDGDEELERGAYRLEREVQSFRDEPRINHNLYPESDEEGSGGDEEGHNEDEGIPSDEEVCRDGQRNREYVQSAEGFLCEDMVFFNHVQFKDVVAQYAIRTGRNLKQYRYDTTKVAYKCVGGNECSWRIYCSRVGKTDEWRIRIFNKIHSCSSIGKCKMIKVPVIARLFLDRIRDEPEYYMPQKIEAVIKKNWKAIVSRHQCQAARKKALRWIEKEYDEQFARL